MASIDRYRPTREGYQPPPVRQAQASGQTAPAAGAAGAAGAAVPPASAIPDRMSQSVSPSRRNANVPPAAPSPPVSSRTSPPAHSQQQRHPHPPSQLGKPPIRAASLTPTSLPPPPPPPVPTAPPPGQPPFASQWYYTEDELVSTPSVLHGLTPAAERERRAKGVNFIYSAGIAVQPQALPQVTLFVAAVFFHRFYMRYSLVEERGGIHHYNIAATALFLANKTEENNFKTRHLIVAVAKVAQKNMNLIVDEQSKEYWRWRDSILTYEELMLEILTFDLNVSNPYDQLWQQLRALGQLGCKPVREAAWSFLNDAGLTSLPLQLDARDLASASIFFASVVSSERLDDVHGQRWWQHVRGDEARMVRAMHVMITFYKENPLKKQHARVHVAAAMSAMADPSAGSASPAYYLEKSRQLPADLAAGMYDGSAGSVSRDVTPMELDRQSQSQSQTQSQSQSQSQTQTQNQTQTQIQAARAPGDSDAALKAAANNLDNGLHPVSDTRQNGTRAFDFNGNSNSNGKREMEEGEYVSSPPANKRPRTVSYEEERERERSRERSRDRNRDRDRDHDYTRDQGRSPSRSHSRDGSRSLSYGS